MSAGNGEHAPAYRIVANEYLAAGLCVVPAGPKKHPVVSDDPKLDKWQRYQSDLPLADEVDDWFANPRRKPFGLGFVCGRVSGGLEVADLDAKHDLAGTLNARAEAAVRAEAPGLWERFVIERTPSGGLHLHYRCAKPEHNLKLARQPNAAGKLMAVAETRGEAGFIVVAPTPGYELIQGQITNPPFLTDEERAALFRALRSLDQSPPSQETQPHVVNSRARTDFHPTGNRPGDAYNASDEWMNLMKGVGWTTRNGKQWTRPGKDLSDGNSANWDTIAELPRHFHCFSPNADPLEEGGTYTPFQLYMFIKCGGDPSRAAKELYAQGYGDRIEPPKPKVVDFEFEEGGRNGASEEQKPVVHLEARSLMDFDLLEPDDPSILLGNCFLTRGDGAIMASTSGVGKSSLAIQWATAWALGRPVFGGGLRPHGPLRSLIMQAEDSKNDMGEFRHSMVHGMKLTPEERALVRERVKVVTDRVHSGLLFIAELKHQIALHRPDIVWINPLMAFIGGNVNDSEEAGRFLRGGLNSLNEPEAFAYIVIHHTSKPPKEPAERRWNEVMYDMAGSADLTNWARAIISLRPTDKEGVFNLVIPKRGWRAGFTKLVKGESGTTFREPTNTIGIRHSTERIKVKTPKGAEVDMRLIHWEACDVTVEEFKKHAGGRKRTIVFADLAPAFPVGAANAAGFRQILKLAQGIRQTLGVSGLDRVIDEAIEDGMLHVDRANPRLPKYFM